MQEGLPELVALIVREGGRIQVDAVSEVREAIDFCRYYAAQAREKFAAPIELPGPTGESNSLSLHGRGVFVCISPWNFPLAIFVGQVAAALAAGNTVLAKPAEQTPLVAALAVGMLHSAGIPTNVLAFLPGDGRVGAAMVAGRECAGVAFTGSTEVARLIARAWPARTARWCR
jgi:RHH-type proline utilization regulon transcriptional repressor/proline dehydrogenase/delta 1-pyrroline-5-carboxylate dehydrogenase